MKAFELVAKHAKLTLYDISTYFWLHFRQDCRSDKPPTCNHCQNVIQRKKTTKCNLALICKGYNNPEINTIPETTVSTTHY